MTRPTRPRARRPPFPVDWSMDQAVMTSKTRRRRYPRRAVALCLGALALSLSVPVPPAGADTPDHTTRYVVLTLDDELPDTYNTDRYQTAVTELRTAAGHVYRGDVYETMGKASTAGLVALQLNSAHGDPLCWLYVNPQNLYTAGFRARNGKSYVFSDTPGYVADEVRRNDGGVDPAVLGMAGTYADLRKNVSAEPTRTDVYDMRSTAYTLGSVLDRQSANGTMRQQVSLAMFKFMAAFSEAARFPHYRDEFSAALDGSSNHQYLDDEALRLRSSWQDISNFAHAVTENPTTSPRYIPGLGTTLHDWQDVRTHVRSIKGKDG
ncbi:ribosome-inactivating family protein [Embleya sp. NPDC020630]|uniref:ribosome-inactivating family protein n=1 Tax=Embleya sp. NPDC020630 TaxID=3363979 RepID=UPI0037B10F2C